MKLDQRYLIMYTQSIVYVGQKGTSPAENVVQMKGNYGHE